MPYQIGVSSQADRTPPASSALVTVVMFAYGFFFLVLELVAIVTMVFGFTEWRITSLQGEPRNSAVSLFIISFIVQAGAYIVAHGVVKKYKKMRSRGYSDLR